MSNFIDPTDFEALKQDDALPSPSGVRLNIMRMCRQEEVSLPDLVMQIQADPVLAGRIIKIGNGASVNKGRPIIAISKDVLLMIGLDAVRQLALAISLTAERRDGGCAGFDYGRFWARTVAMACAAQALAEYYGEAPPSEMFASGLLANIGSLGLASARPDAYSKVLAAHVDIRELPAAETAAFGYTHLDLAAAMMQDWDIPRLFCEAVLHHELPSQSSFDGESRQLRLAEMLHVAAAIADYCVASEEARLPALQALLDAGPPLGGEVDHVVAICDRVVRDWAEWGVMVKITVQTLPPTREVMTQLQEQSAK
ncbi:HDOD domain-containing protein [Herbaspirillum sp. RV1423]|uniref:HDOD domain-containing protein n=1 Tax=Herbaspirillum sp. RV1423 TaxID=1443993 RepID=UPI0004B3443F|nr:HDOD domain-containing protein [Herbaspirillum sp. RV1423]